MVLSFHPQFKKKILSGEKIHTIRQDKPRRWKAGNLIHFATGVRTAKYHCFHVDHCQSVQEIKIDSNRQSVEIEGKLIGDIDSLARNDGFESAEAFWNWLDKPTQGRIIHWTDFTY